jgi:hypothetical protein
MWIAVLFLCADVAHAQAIVKGAATGGERENIPNTRVWIVPVGAVVNPNKCDGHTCVTVNNGNYSIPSVKAGAYEVLACAPGRTGVVYRPDRKPINVQGDQTYTVNLSMPQLTDDARQASVPVEAPGVQLAHVYHRASGCEVAALKTEMNGTFMFRGDIDDKNADYFARTNGVIIQNPNEKAPLLSQSLKRNAK